MSRLVVVGSGTVVPEGDRGGSCYFLEGGGVRALLDCGPGAVQGVARHAVPWERLTHLVLTHFHGDHVGALPGFFFALKHGILPPREEELTVLGPPGTRELFRRLAEALGEYLLDPGFPVRLEELEPGSTRRLSGRVELITRKTPHTDESQALRLEAPGGSVLYTGDTGPDPGLGDFGRGVDVLLCECSLTDEEVGDNHLSPSRVADVAVRAEPELLLLTHIYPHVRREHDVPSLVAAAGWSGRAELARDGADFPLV